MRKLTLILSILFLLSCSSSEKLEEDSNSYILKVEFENVDGLETGANVIYKGENIGAVSDLKISKNKNIDVYIELPLDFKIPVGSDFTIFVSDLMGKRAVNIEFSDSKDFYSEKDKIKGKNQKKLGERVEEDLRDYKALVESSVEIIENNDEYVLVKIKKSNLNDSIIPMILNMNLMNGLIENMLNNKN